MSKAKEMALKAYPVKIAQREGYDENLRERKGFVKGYQQAEKDLEFTWEDVRDICRMWIESKTPFGVTGEALSMEILKRFKDRKELC